MVSESREGVRGGGGPPGEGQASVPLKLRSREQLPVPPSPLETGKLIYSSHYAKFGKKNISAVHETYNHTGNKTECSGNNIDSYSHCGLLHFPFSSVFFLPSSLPAFLSQFPSYFCVASKVDFKTHL